MLTFKLSKLCFCHFAFNGYRPPKYLRCS